SSCAQTPDNIQGNNHNVVLNSENNKVSVEHILDDFDEAFETEYTKFKLPDKSQVIINQPEEICDLELKYVNADKNIKWMENKVRQLAKIFGLPNDVDIKNVNNENELYVIENDKSRVDIRLFSNPSYSMKYNLDLSDIINTKAEYIDRMNSKDNEEYKAIVDKSVKLANEVNSIMDGKLENNPTDLYIQDYNGQKFYELDLQQSYKGLAIQCISPKHPKDGMLLGDNAIMAMAMYSHLLYDSNLNLYFFNGCNNYTPIKSKQIESIVSFKSACDILESKFAENMTLEFDDVKLWYEPRGTILDATTENGFDGTKTIKCTPKWFFIIDEEDGGWHGISYITVDCSTGKIEVVV
ncbi:MAG: hypothetical protein K2F81_03550, partial [Ruminococcus sp.]|nr:hypothetical protein [Ruminococcus sp.]